MNEFLMQMVIMHVIVFYMRCVCMLNILFFIMGNLETPQKVINICKKAHFNANGMTCYANVDVG